MNYEKLQARVNDITNILSGSWENIDSTKLICERADKELLLNKRNVNIRLTGKNKHYWGEQFRLFSKNIQKYGTSHHKAIDGSKIGFNKYSINEKSSPYSNDLYRFDNVDEMKGFVKGYNAMCWIDELKEKGVQ